MYFFLSIFSVLLYLLLKSNKNVEKAKRIYINVMTFFLCLVSSIRHLGAGVDTYQYYLDFTSIGNSSWNSLFADFVDFLEGNPFVSDPGFSIFTKLFASICNNFHVYNFFIAFVFISAIGRIVQRSVRDLSGYVLSYCYYISLMYFNCPNNLMRQTLAMGLLLWATIFIIEKRKYLYSILLIVVAITIHKSSLLGLIPIGLIYVHNVRLIYLSGVVLMPIIMSFGPMLVTFMALNSGSDRYLLYVDVEAEARPIAYIVEMLIFYFIGVFSLKIVKHQSVYVLEAYKCFSLSIAFIALLWVSADMVRISYYFSVWGIPFVANSVEVLKKPLFKKLAYIIVFILLFGRAALYPMPYEFYWGKMDLHDRYLYI